MFDRLVPAAKVEMHGEFLTAKETVAVLLLFSVVESWSELEGA
jgi:hypothetical protein